MVMKILRTEAAFKATENTERVRNRVANRGVSPAESLRLRDERNTVVADTVFIVAEAATEALAILQDNSQVTGRADRRQMRLVFVGCGHSENQGKAEDRERLHGVSWYQKIKRRESALEKGAAKKIVTATRASSNIERKAQSDTPQRSQH
jgi:hypothetical protein